MGRYKDHRGPKRPSYGDEDAPSYDRQTEAPRYSTRSASPTEAVQAVVKWFNAEKGFGFVAVGTSEAFLHIRQLEAAGHKTLPDGATLTVKLGQGQKGPEVVEVLAVDTATAQPGISPQRPASMSGVVGETKECTGTVNFYNEEKGFGFVGLDDGGKDVFVHVTTLRRAGLHSLAEGQRVRMQVGQGQKGVEAKTIELIN
jgi:CspA family cold shock protein